VEAEGDADQAFAGENVGGDPLSDADDLDRADEGDAALDTLRVGAGSGAGGGGQSVSNFVPVALEIVNQE